MISNLPVLSCPYEISSERQATQRPKPVSDRMTMPPAWSYPDCMLARWQFPSSRNPDIGAALPAMIAGDPNMSSARSYHAMLHNGPRRAHPYDNFIRAGRSDSKSNPEYDGQ